MEIKKGGFVCQLAYLFRENKEIPSQVNGCQLFTRFIFFGVFAIFLLCVGAILFVIGLPFAARPSLCDDDNTTAVWVHYQSWPRINGHRIYPLWPILTLWMLSNLSATQAVMIGVLHATIFSTTFWLIIGSFVALIVVVMIRIAIKESETVDLVREFIKAKKQKVCPIVKIVE